MLKARYLHRAYYTYLIHEITLESVQLYGHNSLFNGGKSGLVIGKNNSKSINPVFKYFTDLKKSDKFALIKHSQSSLRSLILLLIIVCKNGR